MILSQTYKRVDVFSNKGVERGSLTLRLYFCFTLPRIQEMSTSVKASSPAEMCDRPDPQLVICYSYTVLCHFFDKTRLVKEQNSTITLAKTQTVIIVFSLWFKRRTGLSQASHQRTG